MMANTPRISNPMATKPAKRSAIQAMSHRAKVPEKNNPTKTMAQQSIPNVFRLCIGGL